MEEGCGDEMMGRDWVRVRCVLTVGVVGCWVVNDRCGDEMMGMRGRGCGYDDEEENQGSGRDGL